MTIVGEKSLEGQLQNYKEALQRKDEILCATEKTLAEVTQERDLLKAQLQHVFKLLGSVHALCVEEGKDFMDLELRLRPERDWW